MWCLYACRCTSICSARCHYASDNASWHIAAVITPMRRGLPVSSRSWFMRVMSAVMWHDTRCRMTVPRPKDMHLWNSCVILNAMYTIYSTACKASKQRHPTPACNAACVPACMCLTVSLPYYNAGHARKAVSTHCVACSTYVELMLRMLGDSTTCWLLCSGAVAVTAATRQQVQCFSVIIIIMLPIKP
jgi:hypothetical protein